MGLPAQDVEPVDINDFLPEFDIIYPVSQFLTSYKVNLHSAPSSYSSPWRESFTVKATRSILNAVKQTRELQIRMDHPGLIWPVIAFEADVLSWDLPEPAERGSVRHHVKAVSGWGVSYWTLDLVVQLNSEQFSAAMRQDQRRKGQRADKSDSDKMLGSIKVDYSGLDEKGMWPASSAYRDKSVWKPGMTFFEEMDEHMPPEVDPMLLSAVAGVSWV